MKKIIFISLCCIFLLCGCKSNNFNKDNNIKENMIVKLEDLKKTKKINIKKLNSNKIIKAINNDDVDKILDILMSGNKIEKNDVIDYIGATYVLEMFDDKNNFLETINLYLPSGTKHIKLNTLGEAYYADVDKILEIIDLKSIGCSPGTICGSEPLSVPAELMFTIQVGNKDCIPVSLAVYNDRTYELFTSYEACKPMEICNSILKYNKSIKGIYNYDVIKIIEDDSNEASKSHLMDNLPEYEIYMAPYYVEKGYDYYYTVEKGQTNKYLEEFLKKIDVDLKVCAEPDYID